MVNTNGSYRFKADSFFPWLLFFTLISVITLTWWQVDVLKSVESWKVVQSWSTIKYLAVGNSLYFFYVGLAYLVCLSLPVLCASVRQCLADSYYSDTRLQRRPTDFAHRSIGNEQSVPHGKNAGDLC